MGTQARGKRSTDVTQTTLSRRGSIAGQPKTSRAAPQTAGQHSESTVDASLEEIQPAVLPPTTGGANRRGGRQTKMKPKPKSKPKPKAIQKPKQKTKSKEMETAAKTGTTEAPDTAAAKNLSLAHGGSSKEGEDGETPRRGGEAVATSDDDSAHSEDDEEEKNGKDDADWVAPSAREPIESSLGEDAAEEVEQVKHHLACQERGNLADVPSRPGNEQADSSPAARTRKRTASQLAAGGMRLHQPARGALWKHRNRCG